MMKSFLLLLVHIIVCHTTLVSSSKSSSSIPSSQFKATENDFSEGNYQSQATTQQQQQHQQQRTKLNNLVTLDLAGMLDVHLSSPSVCNDDNVDDEMYSTTPVFRWGQKYHSKGQDSVPKKSGSIDMPNIHVGGEYNFNKVWYGLTRAITTLSWGNIDARKYNNCHIHGNANQSSNKRQSSKGVSATISAEKGLLSSKDYAINFGIALPITKNALDYIDKQNYIKPRIQSPSSAVVRYETINPNHDNYSTASVIIRSTFLHPRIQLVGKSILKMGESIHGRIQSFDTSPFSSRIQQRRFDLADESSWVPDIRMTPSGKVISDSTFGFSSGHRKGMSNSNSNDNSNSKSNRIGVRLMIKKQINWNILGSLFQQDGGSGGISPASDYDELDNGTQIRLEVCGITGANSFTSIAIDAALERMKETFQCTMAHEGVITS